MRDEFEEEEKDEDGILSGDGSLLDDEDPELLGLDAEEEEDPLKNGFSAMEEEEEPEF